MPKAYSSKKVIFGDDSSRLITKDRYEALPAFIKEVAGRSVVFIRKKDVEILSDGRLKIKKISHKDLAPELSKKDKIRFCDDFNNLTRQNVKLNKGQFCSGFLDSDSVVHSAGHCFSYGMTCKDYYILRNARDEKSIFEKSEFRQCNQSESIIDTGQQTTGPASDQKPSLSYQSDTSDKALLMLEKPFEAGFKEVSVRRSMSVDLPKGNSLTTICGANGFPLHSLTGKVFTVDSKVPKVPVNKKNIKTVMTNIDAGAGCSGGGIVSFDLKNKTFLLEAVNSFIRSPELSLQFPVGTEITQEKNKKKSCISSEKYREEAVSTTQTCNGDKLATEVVREDENVIVKKVVGIKMKGDESECWSGSAGYSTQNYIEDLTRIRQRAKALHGTPSASPKKRRGVK